MPRAEANAALEAQIDEGRRLLEWPVGSDSDYRELNAEHSAWTGFNSELLRRMFTTNQYQVIYGQRFGYSSPMYPTYRDREKLLKGSFISEQISRLNSIRRRLPLIPEASTAAAAGTPGNYVTAVDVQIFDFVGDDALRSIVTSDYREAHLALDVGASKAAALLAAGVIEGMFLHVLGMESVKAKPEYADATKRLRRQPEGEIAWDRAQLDQLVEAAVALELVVDRMRHHGQGARDARDTVHPYNELRFGRAEPVKQGSCSSSCASSPRTSQEWNDGPAEK